MLGTFFLHVKLNLWKWVSKNIFNIFLGNCLTFTIWNGCFLKISTFIFDRTGATCSSNTFCSTLFTKRCTWTMSKSIPHEAMQMTSIHIFMSIRGSHRVSHFQIVLLTNSFNIVPLCAAEIRRVFLATLFTIAHLAYNCMNNVCISFETERQTFNLFLQRDSKLL